MPKLFAILAAAVMLSCLFAWNSQAAISSGIHGVQFQTSSSSVQKAACDKADELCSPEKMLMCKPGKNQDEPECKCETCPNPVPAACACPGRCCPTALGWKCCL